MDWIEVLLTSVSMAVDATTVNAANGLKEPKMKIWKMLLISDVFGVMQFVMPCVGYFIGYAFKDFLEAWIPWIGFTLLGLLAIKTFIDWIEEFRGKEEEVVEKRIGFGEIMVQGVATSIDALCVGFVYLNLSIPYALLAFGIIGVVTFVLSLLAVLLAKQVAGPLSKWAGLLAAIVFLGIGIKILLEGIL